MEEFFSQLNESFNNLLNKLRGWLDTFIVNLPNILLAVLVVAISIFASRYVKRYAKKGMKRFFKDQTVTNFLSSMVTVVFMLIMLFIVLAILNLSQALTSLLAGAGVIGLAIGLALQDPLVNLFSGVMMSTRNLYNIGDLVETNGYTGTIREINLRSTILRTPLGQDVTIPNKMVIENPLVNYFSSGQRKMEFECGISYGEDLQKVKEVVEEAVQHLTVRPGSVDFFYTEFGDSSINFRLRFLLEERSNAYFRKTRSEAMMAIKEAFDRNDITIPFPIRTLDFGVKGGRNLDEALPADLKKINGDTNKK